MQQYNVIATTTVHPRQLEEQLRKTTIQTTIQHVAHLLVVHVDDAAAAHCVHLKSDQVTFLIPRTTWKTKQEPWTPTTRSHEEPNSNNDHNKIIIMIITKISFVYHVIKTCPPCPNNSTCTTNNNKNKKNYKPTRITSHSGTGPTTRHPQPHTKSLQW